MSDARAQILSRIREGLADVPAGERPEDVPVPRDYRREGHADSARLTSELLERLAEYGAVARVVAARELAQAIAGFCDLHGLRRLAAPPALVRRLHVDGVHLVADEGLSIAEIDTIGAAITGCSVAIAQTGTVVLDGSELCGRRALSLVVDHHLCLLGSDQVVELVPEAFDRLAGAIESRRPITMISGPSATSDIELRRVQGLHGPRKLAVFVLEGA